jgi:pimeloyl-ACP methyl ester carboxylesterase
MGSNMKNSVKYFTIKIMNIILILVCIIAGLVLVLLITFLVNSPGKPEPFKDTEGNTIKGSISEKIFIEINGARQGMFIKGRDINNPVLLFLHGGPGMPEYAVSRNYPLVLENYFTVCWWEQRGAGLSFIKGTNPDSLTFDQLIDDAIELTNYLRMRFGKEKIYLMAHSGGTFTGIQTAAKAPELFHAYIAVSQISFQLKSEELAYNYMFEEFKKRGDSGMLKKFERFPVSEINTPDYYKMRDIPMHKLGIGTTHEMRSVITGVVWPVMMNREYTFNEKIRIWQGKAFTTAKAGLWSRLVLTDLKTKVTKLEIPIYFMSGIHDYTTSYTLAKEYFEIIQSPLKVFYTFHESAHSPVFEEPEKMEMIVREDILKKNGSPP